MNDVPRYFTVNDIPKRHQDLLMSEGTYIDDKNGIEKEILYFRDNSGYMPDKEVALEIIEKLKVFYESDGIDEYIKNENKEQKLFNLGFKEDDIYYNYRVKRNVYYFKPFRDDLKRNWSFKCGWCGNKVSSEDSKGYYLFDSSTRIDHLLESDRACSEDCAKLLWKEAYTEFMKKFK